MTAVVHRQRTRFPAVRLALLSADPAAGWAYSYELPAGSNKEALQNRWRYFARSSRAVIHLGRLLHPTLFGLAHDEYGSLYAEVGLSDGQAQGILPSGTATTTAMTLYRAGRKIATSKDPFAYFRVDDAPADYRLVSTTITRPSLARVDARTVWTFRSRAGRQGLPAYLPPILTPNYATDVDLRGRHQARRPLRVVVAFDPTTGTRTTGRVQELRFRWSRDGGRHWNRATVHRLGARRFEAIIPARNLLPGTDITTRIFAADKHGTTITQQLDRALSVRH